MVDGCHIGQETQLSPRRITPEVKRIRDFLMRMHHKTLHFTYLLTKYATGQHKAKFTPGKRATAVCVRRLVFCHLNVVWRPLAEEKLAILTQSVHRWKVHLVGYNSIVHNMGPSSFIQLLLTPKHEKCHKIISEFDFTAVQGHRSWCKWKAHMWLPVTSY